MENAVFLDVIRVAVLGIDVSEKRITSILKVTRIGELGIIFFRCSLLPLLVTADEAFNLGIYNFCP
jgi:hypothetical protein